MTKDKILRFVSKVLGGMFFISLVCYNLVVIHKVICTENDVDEIIKLLKPVEKYDSVYKKINFENLVTSKPELFVYAQFALAPIVLNTKGGIESGPLLILQDCDSISKCVKSQGSIDENTNKSIGIKYEFRSKQFLK